MLQMLAERWLWDHARLSPKALDQGRRQMDAKAKARIEKWTRWLNHDPVDHDLAYNAFLAALGNPADLPPDSRPKLLTYVQGRAFRAVYETRF